MQNSVQRKEKFLRYASGIKKKYQRNIDNHLNKLINNATYFCIRNVLTILYLHHIFHYKPGSRAYRYITL